MNKLPADIKPQELIKILKKLGFAEKGKRGSHVRLKHPDGHWTQVAVHPKPVPKGTLKKILRQTKISIPQLKSLR